MNTRKTKEPAPPLFSKTLLKFPNVCARCGAETDQKLAVKIGAGEPGLKPILLIGHAGHMIHALQELDSGSTKVPCCRNCRRYSRMGRWMSLGFLICGAAIFAIIPKDSGVWPDWLIVVVGFIACTMMLGAFIPYMVGEEKSAPVRIWKTSDGYYYVFHSGIYRSWVEELAVQHAEEH